MGKKKWKVFIISHKYIFDDMYKNDRDFSNKNYEAINVGDEYLYVENNLRVQNQWEWPTFQRLGKWWAESEGIYNY